MSRAASTAEGLTPRLDRFRRTMQEGQRGISARHHQWHVVDFRLFQDYAGERVLLAPDLNVNRHRGPEAAAVVAGARLEASLKPGEGRWLPLQPSIFGEPFGRNVARLAHFAEQPDHRALVFDLGLGDDAPNRQGVEHLADGLRIVLGQDVGDGSADAGHRRPGPPAALRFYVASYIKRVSPVPG